MATGTPSAELEIDEALVRGLLADQHPDLADRTLRWLDAGWDNAMWLLGDDLVVRLPRRQVAVELIVKEQAWLPRLADRLPLPIPAPVRFGAASARYPWPWSIVPWIPGQAADLAAPEDSEARTVADFLLALHQPAPVDAPANPLRGVPLQNKASAGEEHLESLRHKTPWVTPKIEALWREALAAPVANVRHWLHGDLHSRNVLVAGCKISGVIDWGDLTSGDVATDLASVWMLFAQAEARADCLERYEPTDDQLARARGWAIFFGAFLLDTGLVDHPRHAAMGSAIFERLENDA